MRELEIKGMITENDVRAKTDDELLSIWSNQNEYVPEMISWVKAEIERRYLDTSGIHVRKADEIEEEAEVESDRTFVRMISLLQGLMGLVLLVFLVGYIGEQINEWWYQTGDLDIGVPLVILTLGVVLIFYSISVWREKKWAIISGLVVYSIITVLNMLGTVVSAILFFGPIKINHSFRTFLWSCASTIVSGGLALAFNRLRKRRSALTAKTPTDIGRPY